MVRSPDKSRRKEFFATVENPFHFVDSGLDNVYLIGIRYFQEPDGRIVAEIPAVKQLMQLIAYDLVTSPIDLTGKQVKFLRKRLGKKATEFCQYIGVEPETLSRMENEKQQISVQVQKLVRLAYCLLSDERKLADRARDVFQSIVEDVSLPAKKKQKLVLEIGAEDQHWREIKAA
jgi:transcriptional regulator with XRE-family HTH domain